MPPMLAKLERAPPAGTAGWLWEIKFDGYRALALKDGPSVQLLSRNEKDLGRSFGRIAEVVAGLRAATAVLDGELVALDATGKPSFQLLQARELGERLPPLVYYAFDLLMLDGTDLRGLPIEERKRRLKGAPGELRYSAEFEGEVSAVMEAAKRFRLEGLIGERRGSLYESAQRSGAWIKLKFGSDQNFVIGGYTQSEGGRHYFSSLLLGRPVEAGLSFVGKVGIGFSDQQLKTLHGRFQSMLRPSCPFFNLPVLTGGRWGQGGTMRSLWAGMDMRAEMKNCTWVEPRLLCKVHFIEWTSEGYIRLPVFLGLAEGSF